MTGRRTLLAFLLAAGCGLAAAPASAQTYPTRTIKLVIPFPAGGPTDVLARLLADKMTPMLGQNIIVESRPGGAGGTVGAKAVSASDPDGYTLLLSQAGALTISPSINKIARLRAAENARRRWRWPRSVRKSSRSHRACR